MMLLMINNELQRVTHELDTNGYSLTSYDQLGLEFNADLVGRLCTAAAEGTFSASAADLTKHIEKQNMAMVQDENALKLGRLLVAPVVETLFQTSPRARANWNLYAMNRYDAGGAMLGAHQDSVGATVMVVTASGVRDFNVYRKEPEHGVFKEIEQSFRLEPGSVMILDAQVDPGHAVACIEGPSVSAVLDVPDMLRP
jgi:hypothetical protein